MNYHKICRLSCADYVLLNLLMMYSMTFMTGLVSWRGARFFIKVSNISADRVTSFDWSSFSACTLPAQNHRPKGVTPAARRPTLWGAHAHVLWFFVAGRPDVRSITKQLWILRIHQVRPYRGWSTHGKLAWPRTDRRWPKFQHIIIPNSGTYHH